MRIVVLDGHTLNPGDLSWDGLTSLGPCEVYDRTPPEEVVPRARDAEAVLTNKTVVSRKSIEQLPSLKYIGVLATGYDVVDVAAAHERNVVVTNVPAYGTRSVAQMVFAHLLNSTHRVAHHGQTVADGRWVACEDFCYWDDPLVELAGQTMGIVGFGRIGRATAQLALAFGMNVLACDDTPPSTVPEGVSLVDVDFVDVDFVDVDFVDVDFVDLETVFREGDVVSLHCPLTPQTRHVVSAERLSQMKPSAFLINTARGPLVDEPALAAALNSGRIAGAGLDVLAIEPPQPENPLLTAKNCCITPHVAWATLAARQRLLGVVIENVNAFLRGRPQNVVQP